MPMLNGVPRGVRSDESGPPAGADEPHVSFWVEKPFMPEWARMLGKDAGKPKQSGSMYSALALPNSRRKNSLPYKICRTIDSADGEVKSLSSMQGSARNQRARATYTR